MKNLPPNRAEVPAPPATPPLPSPGTPLPPTLGDPVDAPAPIDDPRAPGAPAPVREPSAPPAPVAGRR
ncbi:MAG: hypothetical protein ACXWCN_02010 [Caldimonas sp.]